MTDLDPGTRFGPYVIDGFVAGGGMGRVYAARHEVYGQPVALKVLHERFGADPRWHRRFSEEGLLGMRLKHPCVLSARELVEAEPGVALLMDLVRGGQTLLSVMEREHPGGLTLGPALSVFLQILSGVEYLHEREVVHGDLKPENVLVEGQARDPSTWVPRVTDFGTVSLIADPVVVDGKAAVVASPRYASPEHLDGSDKLEVRSDIYGLGLLLHWLLSGDHLSGARTVAEAVETLGKPPSLMHVVDLPDALQDVLRKALAPDPQDRFQDCRGMALAIREVLDELGVGLELEDLRSELATEIMEERAEAQKALQRGDGPDPSPDDTELDLGSVVEDDGHTSDPQAIEERLADPEEIQAARESEAEAEEAEADDGEAGEAEAEADDGEAEDAEDEDSASDVLSPSGSDGPREEPSAPPEPAASDEGPPARVPDPGAYEGGRAYVPPERPEPRHKIVAAEPGKETSAAEVAEAAASAQSDADGDVGPASRPPSLAMMLLTTMGVGAILGVLTVLGAWLLGWV